jgi:hypothetical protein
MAALVDVLLAPLAPQARYSMLREISSGWRLPPPAVAAGPPSAPGRVQQDGDAPAATTAKTSLKGPQVPEDIAIESLADRCAAVLLISHRSDRRIQPQY